MTEDPQPDELQPNAVEQRYAEFRKNLDTTVPSLHFSWENQASTVFTNEPKTKGRRKDLTPQPPEADNKG